MKRNRLIKTHHYINESYRLRQHTSQTLLSPHYPPAFIFSLLCSRARDLNFILETPPFLQTHHHGHQSNRFIAMVPYSLHGSLAQGMCHHLCSPGPQGPPAGERVPTPPSQARLQALIAEPAGPWPALSLPHVPCSQPEGV